MRTASKFASKWAVIVLGAAGLGIFIATPSSADPTTQPSSSDTTAATGSISGTVTQDGKPLANARVGLIVKPQRVKGKAGKNGGGNSANNGNNNGATNNDSATTQPSQNGEKRPRPTPVATATTDSDGKFTLNDVKVGDYVIAAGVRGEGRGHQHIAVTAGETASVEIQVVQDGANGKGSKRAKKLGV